jgi:DNA-directed RNA polymerase I, II, and III subunit RPABC1
MEQLLRTKIYFRVRKTSIEMLEDRGYEVSDEDKNMNYEDFTNRLEENAIQLIAVYRSNPIKMAYVAFILDAKSFSKKDLVALKATMDEKYVANEVTVIIVQDKQTPQIAKELQNDEYKLYEIFSMKNLMFNITHHEIVPKHILLTHEEVDLILKKYQTTRAQLPKLLTTDPVAKYYGMKAGDVCKIIRQSPMTGESYYYRILK